VQTIVGVIAKGILVSSASFRERRRLEVAARKRVNNLPRIA
jgi:hypothetical protein